MSYEGADSQTERGCLDSENRIFGRNLETISLDAQLNHLEF